MFKKQILAAGVALLLGSSGAMADPFTFDPTGTPGAGGDITNLGAFDQAPGNALAIGGGGVLVAGQRITILYQANLNTANSNNNGTPVFLNGTGGNYFTFVAGFGEVISSGGGPTAGFSFDPTNTVNFFRVYRNSSAGDNLSGANFTGGNLILSGTINSAGFSGSFNQNVGAGLQNFDQFNGDSYNGFQSIVGSGGTSLNATVSFLDANYFPDLTVGTTLAFFNTSIVVPFDTVDPSRAFINNTGTVSAVTAPALGAQNGGAGSGPNFQLQADGNNTFRRAVPEPDSLLLLSLGLGLVGFLGKRRKQAA